jgi:putative DNA primase/helicase
MYSNLQIASVLGGKVHGDGVLAPAPSRGPDDLSMWVFPNQDRTDYVVEPQRGDDPATCREYIDGQLEAAQQRHDLKEQKRQAFRISQGLPAVEPKLVLPPGQTTWFPASEPIRAPSKPVLFPEGYQYSAPPVKPAPAVDWIDLELADTSAAKSDETSSDTSETTTEAIKEASIGAGDTKTELPDDAPIGNVRMSPDGPAAGSARPAPPGNAPPLVPAIADINAHLYALFAPEFVQAYPDSKIEIAYADPKTGNAVNKAEIFSAFDLDKAAQFAFRKNATGLNVYVAPALRSETHKSGRAKGEHVITARYAWCEYDSAGDAERVYKLCKENGLWPAIIVNTGTIPVQRNHLYFAIDGVATPADLTAMGAGLKKLFNTDAVHNADRVLRLAGTVNWPSPKKMEPEYGYVPELTTLRLAPDSPRYSIATLIGFGIANGGGADRDPIDSANSTGKAPRGDDEIQALLEATRQPRNWHTAMRNVVASMIGRGWSDLQIRLVCAQYCDGGADDPDLETLLRGGRDKWNKPDRDEEEVDAKQPDLREGDERVANQAPVASELPTIRVGPRISTMTTRTQKMLIAARVPFYQRGGELVRPIIRTVKAAHGRLTKTAQLKSISAIFMRDTMCRHAHWERMDKRSGEFVKTTAPMSVATTLLERDGIWGFPEIVGVIATPTMRPDGTLLLKQGYDPATRLLLIEPPKMSEIPDQPTREDALKTLALLEELISESPFDDEPSRAVALSGLITPVVRGAFAVAPMHVSSAPVAGSGKSFLWDLVAAISTGQQRIPVIAAGSAEETEKRLVGVMLTAQPLISIDNVNGELKGDFLCQAIEQHVLDIRPLGRSEIARIETGGVTFFATGNNITIVGDLCRRTITSRLDSKLEDPQLRQFEKKPIQAILDDRGTYIAACLTICRAYVAAGRPGLLPRLASFEGWSDTVRSALVWLGKADAVDTMEGIRAEDPQRAALSDLLHAWANDHGTGEGSDVTLAVIIELSLKNEKMGGQDTGEFQYPDLNAAVRAAASAGKGNSFGSKIDPLAFGIWCRQNKGRIVDGLRLANRASSRGGAAKWWVEKIK